MSPVLISLALPLLLLSCNSTKEPAATAKKTRPQFIGVIKGVHENDFVVFKRTTSLIPGAGKQLEWRPRDDGDNGGGILERSPERRGVLFVADIKSGSPEVGDLVFYNQTPGTTGKDAETGDVADARTGEEATGSPEARLLDEAEAGRPASDLPALRPPPEEIQGSVFNQDTDQPAPHRETSHEEGRPASSSNQTAEPPGSPIGRSLPPLRPPPD